MSLSIKVQEILNLIVFSKKIFSKPKKKDILIFDSDLSDYILHYLDKDKVHVLDNRYKQRVGQKINIFIIIKMILKFKLSSYEYFKTYLSYISPKLILTLIDNNKTFYKLKEMYPLAKVMLIQNAWRTADFNDIFKDLDLLRKSKLKCDLILSYNKHVGEKFKTFLHGEIMPIGSFRSNFNLKKNLNKKYDFLYISIFRDPNCMFDTHFKLLKTMNEYFSSKKEKLYVLGSLGTTPNKEKLFYDKYLKDTDYVFIPRGKKRPTYDIVDQSNIILTVESTLGYEAFARGNKVAYFSIRKDSYPDNTAKFGWPANKEDNGPFWVNSTDLITFKKIINFLENINQNEYSKILKDHTSDLIEYDEGNKKFNEIVNKII